MRPSLPAILYDASRLATRTLTPTPNGIDRLDALLCGNLLSGPSASTLVFGWGGPRLLSAAQGLDALARAQRMWGEHGRGHAGGRALPIVVAWLRRHDPTTRRMVEARRGRLSAALCGLARVGLRSGDDPVARAPRHAVCLNAAHFPLDWPSHVAWLGARPDIRLVAMVHDLLPVEHPAWFWSGEPDRHRARLALLARRGAGALVTSQTVAARLHAAMGKAGRGEMPILAAAPPVSAVFDAPARRDAALSEACYFVVCGTIEPRKNHPLVLRVWRRLVAEMGVHAPKLLVVGKRGWLCDAIVAELEAPALAGHVLEVTGLPTVDYKHLLDHACALLAPSLAEGFGLTIAEALATGTPVVASDIPPFREQRTSAVTLLDPQADALWYDVIVALAASRGGPAAGRPRRRAVTVDTYIAEVRGFLAGLA